VSRIGERMILAVGIGIVAVSSFLAGFSNDITQLIALRGVGGLGSAMFSVAALSLLLRVAKPNQRGQSAAAFQGGFLLGGIAGPAIGAPLVVWSLRAPFFFYAATLVAAGTVALVFLRQARLSDPSGAPEVAPTLVPFTVAIRNRAYLAALLNNFASGWAQSGTRSLLLPLFVVYALGASVAWVSIGVFVSAATQFVALGYAGRITDTRGRKLPLFAGQTLALLGVLSITVFESLPVYLFAMVVFGVSGAFIGSSSAAVVGDVVGGRGGTSVAGYQMSSDAAVMIAPLVLGALTAGDTYVSGFAASAAVAALGLAFVATMPETLSRTQPGATHVAHDDGTAADPLDPPATDAPEART
jgi:MFS family permease